MKKLPVIYAIAALLAMTHLASAEYTIIDLGTLGGSSSWANGVNDSGQVVGSSYRSPWNFSAFIWQNGVMTNLGVNNYSDSRGYGINNSGQVVGGSAAFLWQDGVMTDIGTFTDWTSSAYGINNTAQVVGQAAANEGRCYAFLWEQDSGFVSLGMLPYGWDQLWGNHSGARGINDGGQVVGWSYVDSSSHKHAFLLTPEGDNWYRDTDEDGYNDLMVDLGTLGGDNSNAFATNNSDQVVGWAEIPDGNEHACLWNLGAGVVDLGTLGGSTSHALGINNLGHVVGYSTTVGGESHAFLWQNGSMIDLNDQIFPESGWQLKEARDINKDEWIVGYGTNPNGEEHAFLLVQEPICASKPKADLDDNCKVNFNDFAIFAKAWKSQPCDANWNQACDISDPNDNVINMRDLAVVVECWLECNLLPPEACWE